MKHTARILICLLSVFVLKTAQAQGETETITISRKTILYKGTGQEIQNWYLYMDSERTWYMAPLVGIPEKPEDWFEKRKDSQSVYKGSMQNGLYPTLTLDKVNDPEGTMSFYVSRPNEKQIVLTSVSDAQVYVFEQQ